MALLPSSEIVVTIEKPVAGGRMLARHEGQVVLVAGAVPGERVRVRIDRVSKHLAFGHTADIIEASPDRRSRDVDWACGGSFYAHIAYERQARLKSEVIGDAFARIARLPLAEPTPVMPSQEHGYRMRARLHVKNGVFGFFREGSHDLCDAASTHQLLPGTIEALRQLQSALGATQVTSCELLENTAASERAVLLELAPGASAPDAVEPVAGLSGLLFVDHAQGHLSIVHGSPYVRDHIPTPAGSVELTHHVQSFFQGNRHLLADLVRQVLAQVPEGTVTDLYAGVGLFAVALAAQGHKAIIAVEGDRASARDLEANAEPFAARIHVEHLSVESYMQRRSVQRTDTLLLDPPRTGISTEAMSAMIGVKPRRVVYLSCDPATLARDVKRFVEAGYRLEHIEAFDLFPNTAHIETLAILVRM
jgi:23S rRNA (uracil1939-C5)-methyltransferase